MAPRIVKIHTRVFIRNHTKGLTLSSFFRVLQENGIYSILNVAIIPDYYLEDKCRMIGMKYRHEPLHDSQEIETEKILELISYVQKETNAHGILVHCDSGKNRSLLVTVPAIVRMTNQDPAEIIKRIRTIRPQILDNPRFEEWILNRENYDTINDFAKFPLIQPEIRN